MSDQELRTMTPLDFFFYVLKRTMSFDYSYADSLVWAMDQTGKAYPGDPSVIAIAQGLQLMKTWYTQTNSYGKFGYSVNDSEDCSQAYYLDRAP